MWFFITKGSIDLSKIDSVSLCILIGSVMDRPEEDVSEQGEVDEKCASDSLEKFYVQTDIVEDEVEKLLRVTRISCWTNRTLERFRPETDLEVWVGLDKSERDASPCQRKTVNLEKFGDVLETCTITGVTNLPRDGDSTQLKVIKKSKIQYIVKKYLQKGPGEGLAQSKRTVYGNVVVLGVTVFWIMSNINTKINTLIRYRQKRLPYIWGIPVPGPVTVDSSYMGHP